MIDLEKLEAVKASLQTQDIEAFQKLDAAHKLWVAGIIGESAMALQLIYYTNLVIEILAPTASPEMILLGISIDESDLEGIEKKDRGERWELLRSNGESWVWINKNLDKAIFNELINTRR